MGEEFMMRAGYYERLGDPLETVQVGEMPIPRPGPGEVLVRVHVSGINPSDLKRATGWAGAPMAHPRVIPNNDGAGVIDAIGDGLPATLIGQRVWIYEATLVGPRQGTAAQYCVVPVDYAVPLPANADFSFGACLGVPAMTAHRAVFSEGPVEGKTVLVAGGSPEKAAIAREAGADEVFLYTDPDLAEKITACAAGGPAGSVSHVVEVHFRDNIALDARVLETNGTVSLYGSSDDPDEQPVVPMRDLLRKGINLRWVMVYALDPKARAAALRDIERAIIEGGITPLVAARYELDDLAQAMAAVGVAGTGGKVLVDLD
jgi:NADPH2:quinone reductase